MKKIDLIELDQFGNIVQKSSWNINGISSNKFEIDFGDSKYLFDGKGNLLESKKLLSSTPITLNDLLTLNKDENL